MKSTVLLVAHDAGGAEILSAWSAKNRADHRLQVCLAGPAVKIFNRDHQGLSPVPLQFMERLGRSDLVLTGSSLEADLERNAIALAQQLQIPCVTFLDHWDLYRERFGDAGHWRAGLPDEIWVGDRYAYRHAQQQGFPADKLRLVANPYWQAIQDQADGGGSETATGILYICEPIHRKLAAAFGEMASQYHDEMILMEQFLTALRSHRGEFSRVTVRLHPSEQKSKYEAIMAGYQQELPLAFSSKERLVDDLLSHSIIVGIESNALAIAAHLGKPVYSCITGKSWPISLPQQEIHRINSFQHIFQPQRERVCN